MKIKNDGISLKDRIGKVSPESIYYCPNCGNVYVGALICPLCGQHGQRQVALPKAEGMENYRPDFTRITNGKGKLQWRKEIRTRILDVFLQYQNQLVQLPYGQQQFMVDLADLKAVLVFSAAHVLYKWPADEL